MKRAFVTGGSGFVGGRIVATLVARGIEVRALARSDRSVQAVEALGATAVRGDLSAVDASSTGMTGCDVVFHAAAHVEDHGKLSEFMAINVGGTEAMLDCARRANVKRFVHIGTEAVLADGKPIVRADETRPFPKRPAGPYPITKGLAEVAVVTANGALETVVVRPRFIWGKGDTSVLPDIVEKCRRGRFAWIAGGHYLTSTCHVDNVVEGALLAAERGKGGEVYFLTDGEPVDLRDFLTQLIATHGVDAGAREVPRWLAKLVAAVTSWMTTPPVSKTALALIGGEVTVSDAKARRELGYRGVKSIDEGLAEMRRSVIVAA